MFRRSASFTLFPYTTLFRSMGMGKFGVVLVVAGAALWAVPAVAQAQERTIRWGHLNNTDHPVSLGVQKFAEVLAAKSGGKLRSEEHTSELQSQFHLVCRLLL